MFVKFIIRYASKKVLVDTDLIDADNRQLNAKLFVERRLSTSFYNVGEAIIVARYIKVLLSTFGLHCFQIGCITPYTAQSQTIRKHVDLNRLNSKNCKYLLIIIILNVIRNCLTIKQKQGRKTLKLFLKIWMSVLWTPFKGNSVRLIN